MWIFVHVNLLMHAYTYILSKFSRLSHSGQNLPLCDREHLVRVATASRSHSILELMMDECILVKFKSMLIDSDSTEKLALVDTDLHLDICF